MRNRILTVGGIVFGMILISIVLTIAGFGFLESLRIVFGSVFVLFLPGFVISFIFFPKSKRIEARGEGAIDWMERIALSFALSIAIVPLFVFYLNLVGVGINLLNSFLSVLVIILVSLGILYFRKKRTEKK